MIIVENIDEFESKYGKIKGWFLSIAWTLFFIVAESCVDALMVSLALKSSKIVFRAFEILNISDLGFIDYFTAFCFIHLVFNKKIRFKYKSSGLRDSFFIKEARQ